MSDDAFYGQDGEPIIPLTMFLVGLLWFTPVAVFKGRVFALDWWDFQWRMFCAARLCDRAGKIYWWRKPEHCDE